MEKERKIGMDKKYFEFDNELELNKHLKYWSNACGELHHHGEYDLDNILELPEELQRAYNELWKEGNGCLEYLVEYDGKYYIALVSEFDDTFADDSNISMEELACFLFYFHCVSIHNFFLSPDKIPILFVYFPNIQIYSVLYFIIYIF